MYEDTLIIKTVCVENYRPIRNVTLECNALTALVGSNGSGKSTLLNAIRLFYDYKYKPIVEDFYDLDTSNPIAITITFSDIPVEASKSFRRYVRNQNLVVKCIFSFANGKVERKDHGTLLQNPDFMRIRNMNAVDGAKEYNRMREKYQLPKWNGKGNAHETMQEWEDAHSEECTAEEDDGIFFGSGGSGRVYIERHTSMLYIPAVRDASEDAGDGRGSALTDLVERVVQANMLKNEKVQEFEASVRDQYSTIVRQSSVQEFEDLALRITDTLNTFAPQSTVKLHPKQHDFKLSLPSADVRLEENGHLADVGRVGHGLQRAFIMAILTVLHETRKVAADESAGRGRQPDLVLLIEEPETYQHPSRQRHLANIFGDLTTSNYNVPKTQIIYSTHSPHFVGIDRIENLRLLRPRTSSDDSRGTRISQVKLDGIVEKLRSNSTNRNTDFSRDSLVSRLYSIMNPWMNEGFFARRVVLVEGPSDREALLATGKAMNRDLEADDISVIPCSGKTNIDKPLLIFSDLGIPTYTIWDSDYTIQNSEKKEKHTKVNIYLQKLLNVSDIQEWPNTVESNYACFEHTIETALQNHLTKSKYDSYLKICKDQYGIGNGGRAIKNPSVMRVVMNMAKQDGRLSGMLDPIIEKIYAMGDEAL